MAPRKYPLDPLLRVRRERVDASVKVLAGAIAAREDAERARVDAEAERACKAEEARRMRDAELRALGCGDLSVADLQRQGAWEARVRWEDEAQAHNVKAATEREMTARAGEGEARGKVASAEADSKVVTSHRDGWVRAEVRAAEVAAEEGAAEAWRPKR